MATCAGCGYLSTRRKTVDRSAPYNRDMAKMRAVGRNVLRKEGHAKVTGAAKYLDDLRFDGLLHARTIRSTIPAGTVSRIAFDFDLTGFTVVDHRDIPG